MTDADLASRAHARLGVVLRGKYQLERVLGMGGMASVYAATHRNGKEFAVKVLHPELALHGEIRARFLREGYAANALKHPGAVAVLDDDVTDDGTVFLVMELLEGETLEAIWERSGRSLPVDRAASVGAELLDVLSAAHAHGIVHRDIKPANLFVTREGRLKVLDFGIARVRDAALNGGNVTQTGATMGTPSFMAPEQAMARSAQIDARTDIWAVGATLFTLVSGHVVHEGENAQHLVVVAATTPARSLATVAPHVPLPFAEVVDRALAFDRNARWPDAISMRDALLSAGATAGHGASLASVPSWPAATVAIGPALGPTTAGAVSTGRARPAGSSRAGVVVGVGVAVVVAGLGAAALLGRSVSVRHAAAEPSTGAAVIEASASPAPSAPPAAAPVVSLAPESLPVVPSAAVPMPPKQAAPRAAPAAPAATKPGCAPNYFFDADGYKHFKPECF